MIDINQKKQDAISSLLYLVDGESVEAKIFMDIIDELIKARIQEFIDDNFIGSDE